MMMPKTTPCVKMLIIINLVCWFFLVTIIQKIFIKTDIVYQLFGFVPSAIDSKFFIWQFFTYMFIHSSGMFHILFNMMVLWMFGSELEQLWRKKFFLTYYLVCGVGAALVYFIGIKLYALFGGQSAIMNVPVVGASGAVFGLLLAYGLIFGERLVLFMFLFPMKARTFTFLIAGVELLSMLQSGLGSPVANLAHLGGLVSGFLFLRFRAVSQTHLPNKAFFKFSKIFKMKKLKILKDPEDSAESNSSKPKYWN